MAGEKHFGNTLFGFSKQDVNSYIENLIKDFENKIKGYEAEIDRLTNENRELRQKYEKIAAEEERIYQEKERIAEVLLQAQKNAQLMIEEARIKAIEERNKIQEITEKEKEKLVDIKEQIRTLKMVVTNTLKKYEAQLDGIVDEVPENNNTEENSALDEVAAASGLDE